MIPPIAGQRSQSAVTTKLLRLCTALSMAALVCIKGCRADELDDSSPFVAFPSTRRSAFRGDSSAFEPPAPPVPPAPPTPPTLPGGLFELERESSNSSASPLVWQPLPLRATFKPLNRRPATAAAAAAAALVAEASSTGEPAGLISERSISPDAVANTDSAPGPFSARTFFPTAANGGNTRAPPLLSFEPDDEQPTRLPMNRFRPLARDTSSAAPEPSGSDLPSPTSANEDDEFQPPPAAPNFTLPATNATYQITSECFECICEASTNCNANSKCQTSDVRHTRCGMFLISYDQWLATNLSKELVTREALARDAAADERAFYECVTKRDCAQRLLAIYARRNQKDCDRDGRIDCYDLAAVHHSGPEQCASETLLDSQYWSDFNACFGFGR